MSKFTRKLDKIYGAHTLTAILASDVDEPKKEEQPEKPAEKQAELKSEKFSLSAA